MPENIAATLRRMIADRERAAELNPARMVNGEPYPAVFLASEIAAVLDMPALPPATADFTADDALHGTIAAVGQFNDPHLMVAAILVTIQLNPDLFTPAALAAAANARTATEETVHDV